MAANLDQPLLGYASPIRGLSGMYQGIPEELINRLGLDRDIDVGDPLDPVNIKDADVAAALLALYQGKNLVITEEVVETARNRAWILRSAHAQQQFQQGGNEGIMAMLHEIRQDLNDFRRNVNDRLDALEQDLHQVRATARSARVINRNQRVRDAGGDQYHLRPKENPGSGIALAQRIHQGQVPAGVDINPPPAIGSVPNDNLDPLLAQADVILRLISFYNDDFGIVPGDSIESQRQKLAHWLTEDRI